MRPACAPPVGWRSGSPTRTATVLSPATADCNSAAAPAAPATRLVPFGDGTIRAPAPTCDHRPSSAVLASASSKAGADTTAPTGAQRGFALALEAACAGP